MPLSASLPRSTTLRGVARAIGLAALAAGISAAESGAQAIGGSMQASVTILEPVASVAPRATAFSVSSAGVASLQTNAPVSGPTSQVLMVAVRGEDSLTTAGLSVTVRSGLRQQTLVPGAAIPVGADGLAPSSSVGADFRLSYQMRLADAATAAGAPVKVHVSYLAVPGT